MPYIGGENIPGRGINALDTATNTDGPSAGLQAVLAQLRANGATKFDANAIRNIVNENARPPGNIEQYEPNLGPVVLNLRNAGIEDAMPMPPSRGRTSAPPARDTSPQPPPSSPGSGYVPQPGAPPFQPNLPIPQPSGPNPSGGPGGTPLPPSGAPVPSPSPPPMLPPPDATAMVPPPGSGGPTGLAALAPLILGGIPLGPLLDRARANLSLSGPRAPTDMAVAGPRDVEAAAAERAGRSPVQPSGRVIDVPNTALPAPPAQRALAGPPADATPRIAGPAPQGAIGGPGPQLALPAPPPSYRPPLVEGQPLAGFQPEIPRAPDPVGAAIDKAVPADAPAAPRARTRSRARGRMRV